MKLYLEDRGLINKALENYISHVNNKDKVKVCDLIHKMKMEE